MELGRICPMTFHFKLNIQQEKLIAEFNQSRKKYLSLGLVLLLIFLVAIYLGPFGGLERFGLIGLKKEKEQPSFAETKPNDPQFASQWALAKIRAKEAWDITTGSRSIKVAIVGSGVDSNHPDLRDNMIAGYNAINPGAGTEDSLLEGTLTAGVIGATSNNELDIAGLNWQVSLIPVKSCTTFDCDPNLVAKGIRWAADNGAKIIQVNAISSRSSSELESAVSYAQDRGAITVTFAFRGADGTLWYPAPYPQVVVVGAINQTDSVPLIVGSELDIVSPGFGIISTWPGGGTRTSDGPHFAAAHVSGVLALLLSKGVSTEAAVRAIYEGAVDLGTAGRDNTYGWGRLDACEAFKAAGITCPWVPNQTPTPTSSPLLPTPTPILSPIPSPTPSPLQTPSPVPSVINSATISGVVSSSAGGLIEGAKVEVELLPFYQSFGSATTDTAGLYSLANLENIRAYRLKVSAAGFETQYIYLTLAADSTTRNITLKKL